MQTSSCFIRAADVPSAEFGDELAVMDLKSGSYISFNRTAAEVWKLLDQARTLDAICDILAQRYQLDPLRCRSDVEELLSELRQMGVIEQRDG